jgi:DNA-binding Xre family transcriptional regulator
MKLNTPKIKKEMLRNNWNITVLAKRIGISRQQLSYVISDRYKSKSLLIIERIAKALKINQRDLIK